MREYPLTEKQIELCDYLLSIKNKRIDHNYLASKGYDHNVDLNVSANFLIDNKIISSAEPVCLTDIGTKYLKTGIVKFFKDQRRDEFLNSVIVRTVAVWFGILISLAFGITNFVQNRQNSHNYEGYIKRSELDSILYEKYFINNDSSKDKHQTDNFENDSINIKL